MLMLDQANAAAHNAYMPSFHFNMKYHPGDRFGRLTLLEYRGGRKEGRQPTWLCRCDCGKEKEVRMAQMASGKTKSCGCLNKEMAAARAKHGHTRKYGYTKEYVAWRAMKQRCYAKSHRAFPFYGGRGIAVCGRWRHDFEAFLADVGPAPASEYSIDRIDSNGHYEPGNVRWAHMHQQSRNKRNGVVLIINGERVPLVDACEKAGIKYATGYFRLRQGLPVDQILSASPRR